ncbi:MAG TPA: 6-phosphogluconolactonase [Candidatus Dormibacteraeota bacterium]|nr:6-phosphogluconolactonase [Candidatus Dormibacteraeota bacterium]
MKYILTAGWEDGVADLTERLVRELAAGRRVLWLTSGGSNTMPTVQIMANIPANLRSKLSVMPIDERYGETGHDESNWAQLLRAGFEGGEAALLPVLEDGLSFEQTIDRYNQMAIQAFNDNEVIVAQLGVGGDGHVAGILPGSSAATETDDLAVGYRSDPLTRLTLTFAALRRISAAYIFAFGNTKKEALKKLQTQSVPLDRQPAQVLKQLPEAYFYSDQFGDGQ